MEMMSKALVAGSLSAIAEIANAQDSDAEHKQLEQRRADVAAQFGHRARVVAPYKPNRKQRRAQKAAEKKAKLNKKEVV